MSAPQTPSELPSACVCGALDGNHVGECHFGWHNPQTCPQDHRRQAQAPETTSKCPYGEQYAHSITDLIPERPWDRECKPKATRPCPLGFDCPVYEKTETYYSSTTSEPVVLANPIAKD